MGRRSYLDTDEERLPEGMVRIGYDADEGRYTFRDTSDGSIWESISSATYGRMIKVRDSEGRNVRPKRPRAPSPPPLTPEQRRRLLEQTQPFLYPGQPPAYEEEEEGSAAPAPADVEGASPPPTSAREARRHQRLKNNGMRVTAPSWRAELMPLLNFFLLIGMFLIGVFFLLRGSGGAGPVSKDRESSSSAKPIVECGVGYVPYSVKQGDTCWHLSQKHSTTVEELVHVNEGFGVKVECENLKVGGEICLPGK